MIRSEKTRFAHASLIWAINTIYDHKRELLKSNVLSPGNSKGSTLDPDTAAHEHQSYFFPDSGHGAANAAGFG